MINYKILFEFLRGKYYFYTLTWRKVHAVWAGVGLDLVRRLIKGDCTWL